MSYRSRVDIRIGRIPEVPDEELYPLFQEVFNALHILNANIDAAVDVLVPPEPGDSPNESFAPRLNTFWAPAADNVTVGRVVSMQGEEFKRGVDSTSGVTNPFGICLEDSENGKARIGWPPFVLEINLSETGVSIGNTIHTDNTGKIYYIGASTDTKFKPVGQVINTNMVLFIPNLRS